MKMPEKFPYTADMTVQQFVQSCCTERDLLRDDLVPALRACYHAPETMLAVLMQRAHRYYMGSNWDSVFEGTPTLEWVGGQRKFLRALQNPEDHPRKSVDALGVGALLSAIESVLLRQQEEGFKAHSWDSRNGQIARCGDLYKECIRYARMHVFYCELLDNLQEF